ncbi:amidase [soil metagenome]
MSKIDRRNFIKKSAAAGIAITSLSAITSTSFPAFSRSKNDMDATNISKDDFALNELTIAELQNKMQSGEYTSQMITGMYLRRIEEIDKNGYKINSVIEINPDALSIAEQMDTERKNGKLRGLMHGIPILIKDNINTGDKMMTTAGALALVGNIASEDAFIVKQLREAGAVLLGKTNLSEWANIRSTRSTSGWSSRGGQTKNPLVLDRNPCGSSSGSGAAISANFCTVAVGTETDGSVIAPSSFCGIVGMKPTVGLLSRSGIIPISSTQDTAGPMSRTVKDAAILLGAMTGVDANDKITAESKGRSYTDYTKYLDANGLKGKRIGAEKSFLTGHEGIVALYKDAINKLQDLGATVIEVELLKLTAELGDAEYAVLEYEFKDGVNKYLLGSNAKVRSLSDVIKFNKENEKTAMPWFKQEILEICNSHGDLNSKIYKDALIKATSARKIIDDLMKKNKLDAICSTSIGPACMTDLVNGDYNTGFYFCSPAAMAGYPHITVPMGKIHELPVGLSLIASAYQEPELFKYAYAFEQATLYREAPKFLNSVE